MKEVLLKMVCRGCHYETRELMLKITDSDDSDDFIFKKELDGKKPFRRYFDRIVICPKCCLASRIDEVETVEWERDYKV